MALVGTPVVAAFLIRVVHAHHHLHFVLDSHSHDVVGSPFADIHHTVALVVCAVAPSDVLGVCGSLMTIDGAEKEAVVDRMAVAFGHWHWLLVSMDFQQQLPFVSPRG